MITDPCLDRHLEHTKVSSRRTRRREEDSESLETFPFGHFMPDQDQERQTIETETMFFLQFQVRFVFIDQALNLFPRSNRRRRFAHLLLKIKSLVFVRPPSIDLHFGHFEGNTEVRRRSCRCSPRFVHRHIWRISTKRSSLGRRTFVRSLTSAWSRRDLFVEWRDERNEWIHSMSIDVRRCDRLVERVIRTSLRLTRRSRSPWGIVDIPTCSTYSIDRDRSISNDWESIYNDERCQHEEILFLSHFWSLMRCRCRFFEWVPIKCWRPSTQWSLDEGSSTIRCNSSR